MRKVYKYPLKITDEQEVLMPRGSTLLSVANQDGTLNVWAEVDTAEPMTERVVFQVIGTGNPIPEGRRREYLGTVVMPVFVWHVYYRRTQ